MPTPVYEAAVDTNLTPYADIAARASRLGFVYEGFSGGNLRFRLPNPQGPLSQHEVRSFAQRIYNELDQSRIPGVKALLEQAEGIVIIPGR